MSRTSVRARGVSARTSATVATRHGNRASPAVESGVTLVPLLAPRVATVVVAELLPEPARVPRQELQPAHPLCALPEIEVRHKQARRPTVFGVERLAVVAECQPGLSAG